MVLLVPSQDVSQLLIDTLYMHTSSEDNTYKSLRVVLIFRCFV